MAITLVAGARNAACDAVVDLCEVGSADASGDISIWTTAFGTELAILPLSNPAFGAASAGVATANAITDETTAVAGTAAVFRMRDRDNATILDGNVQVSGGDINLSSLVFATNDTVSITSLTVTMPAS